MHLTLLVEKVLLVSIVYVAFVLYRKAFVIMNVADNGVGQIANDTANYNQKPKDARYIIVITRQT
jgi:hypothetical protein